jgi:hypothetical protein
MRRIAFVFVRDPVPLTFRTPLSALSSLESTACVEPPFSSAPCEVHLDEDNRVAKGLRCSHLPRGLTDLVPSADRRFAQCPLLIRSLAAAMPPF